MRDAHKLTRQDALYGCTASEPICIHLFSQPQIESTLVVVHGYLEKKLGKRKLYKKKLQVCFIFAHWASLTKLELPPKNYISSFLDKLCLKVIASTLCTRLRLR